MILRSGLVLNKVQTALSENLGILPKIREGVKSARVWVNTASSAISIVGLVCSVMWCGSSMKFDGL